MEIFKESMMPGYILKPEYGFFYKEKNREVSQPHSVLVIVMSRFFFEYD
jgi:hypothetical protein